VSVRSPADSDFTRESESRRAGLATDTMASSSDDPVVVVGAGLAGSMMALMLASRGLRVELYEKRRAEERADEGDGQAK